MAQPRGRFWRPSRATGSSCSRVRGEAHEEGVNGESGDTHVWSWERTWQGQACQHRSRRHCSPMYVPHGLTACRSAPVLGVAQSHFPTPGAGTPVQNNMRELHGEEQELHAAP